MKRYNDLIYDKQRVKDYNHLDSETKKIIEWIGTSKNVLEFGCHTGCLSEWLQKNDCKVTGVDLNETALRIAHPYLNEAIAANIEDENFWKLIDGKKFHVITWMHVLEHLIEPWNILKKSTEYLYPNGEIIIALPNINNAKDRFHILFGEFNYTMDGVMDKTHLRFFNQKTAREMIDQAGLKIVDYYTPWQANPMYYFLDHFPVIWKLKNLWKPNDVSFPFHHRPNLTDVVMMFRCKLK